MMQQPTLFLMLGYPGAGKTTVARIIHKLTGARHVWADHERSKRIEQPTYSHTENLWLYDRLNKEVEGLLQQGNNVIFDTNFNFYKDRQKLRKIAAKHGAKTVVIWLTTNKDLARERATEHDLNGNHTRILGNMPVDHFERIANNLQEPQPDETTLTFDGTSVDEASIARALKTV